MHPIQLYIFGAPRLERQGQHVEVRPRKALALLIYLAVTGRSHSRDTLATMFWPESNQPDARASLRRTLHRLTQSLQGSILEAHGDTVGISTQAELWLDVRAYRGAVERCMPAHGPVSETCLPHLVEAVDLYTNDFLAGFSLPDSPSFDEWQFFQQEELRRIQGKALEATVNALETGGELEQALRYARQRVVLDPLDEPAHRYLIRLYAQTGQQAAAVRQYQECHRTLSTELGVPPGADTQELYAAVKSRNLSVQPGPPSEQPIMRRPGVTSAEQIVSSAEDAGTSCDAVLYNLAPQPTPFIGRVAELSQVRHLLVDETGCRLLVLVGPGGIGKTRLALQVAKELAQQPVSTAPFPDGVYLVSLESVTASTGIIQALAETLRLPLFDNTSRERQLYDHLRNKRLLFVLDNYEYLRGEATKISEILAALPDIKLLITSREGIALQEAWFFPLSGLSFPSANTAALPAARDYEAMRLFEQSARRVRLDFSLEREQQHVAEICRLVEGMPLALEMSVSWLRVLKAADIAKELGRNLDILTAQFQNFPDRHRSMRVVIEHSWAMLAEQEADVLMRLSVFAGGFRKEAAVQVADASIRLLARLVDKSFVSVDETAWYHLHELVRRFASERLNEASERAVATRTRHSEYYLALQRIPLLLCHRFTV